MSRFGHMRFRYMETWSLRLGGQWLRKALALLALFGCVSGGHGAILLAEPADSHSGHTIARHITMPAQDPDTVELVLVPGAVYENDGRASVYAFLLGQARSSAITVTVITSSSDVVQSGTTLTIPAGATSGSGTVELETVDNDNFDGDRTIAVTGTATGGVVVKSASLRIIDDEVPVRLSFRVSTSAIYESVARGVNHASVIVQSNRPVPGTVTVNVSVSPNNASTLASDFAVTGSVLTIPEGSARSTGSVTITAVNNDVWNAIKAVEVSGTGAGVPGIQGPNNRVIHIFNDDLPVSIRVRARPNVINEKGGTTTLTAMADRPPPEDIVIPLSVIQGDSSLVTFSANRTLTIRKGETTSTGSVTVAAVDGIIVDARGSESVDIGREGASHPGSHVFSDKITLYRPDRPRGWLLVVAERSTMLESDGPTRIYARLNEPPTDTVKLEISVDSSFTSADSSLFKLSPERELTILPGATESIGTVEIRPIDNDSYDPTAMRLVYEKTTVTQGQSQVRIIQSVSNIHIRDDESAPNVMLELSPGEIGEDGGTTTVTARMNHPIRYETTTVTVAANPLLHAATGDFVQSGTTLTIAPGATTSTGSVTITAVDNSADEPDKVIRISGSVSVTTTETGLYVGRHRLPPPQHLRIVDNDLGAPAPPSLTATAQGRTTIALSWLPPAFDGGSPVTGYRIEVSADGGGNWSDLVANTGNVQTEYDHEGLEAGTTRHYRVRAMTDGGESGPSNVASATTDAPASPDTPIDLTATAQGSTSIRLSWSPPSETGGLPVTGYRIEVSADGGVAWTDLVANSADATTLHTHAGLAPETMRHYRVRAITAGGESGPSNVASATTGPAPELGAPIRLEAVAQGRYAIFLSWSPPSETGGSPVTGYRIEVSADGGVAWTNLVANSTDASTLYTHTGLAPGTTRHYRVRAITAGGESDPSNVASATTDATSAPGEPIRLEATADGRHAIVLSWTPPVDDGGLVVAGYRIEVSADGGIAWTDLVANSADVATTYRHTGLAPGTTRHYRVRAINSIGESGPSNVASATTDAASVPGEPIRLEATADGRYAIVLSWTPPTDDGGFAVAGSGSRCQPTPGRVGEISWPTHPLPRPHTATPASRRGRRATTGSAPSTPSARASHRTRPAPPPMRSRHPENRSALRLWPTGIMQSFCPGLRR